MKLSETSWINYDYYLIDGISCILGSCAVFDGEELAKKCTASPSASEQFLSPKPVMIELPDTSICIQRRPDPETRAWQCVYTEQMLV